MTSKIKASNSRYSTALAAALLAIALSALVALLCQITVYSDDYYFGTFLSYDWKNFAANTVDHYFHANGRMLVHFLDELTLLGDTKIYIFLCPVVICLGVYLVLRLELEDFSLKEACFGMAIAVFLLLSLSGSMLQSSLLWISGSFNFVLPLSLVLAAVFFQQKTLKTGKISVVGMILAFLAGATTEQYGFYTCIALWGLGIMNGVRTKKQWQKGFILPLWAVLGLLTVLTAPATWYRMGNDGGGFLLLLEPGVFAERFYELMSYPFGAHGCSVLLTLFCLVSASLVFLKERYPKILVIGYPVALFLVFFGKSLVILAGGVFLGYLLFLGIVFVSKAENTAVGCLLLAALGTQLLLLVTAVCGYRTTMPLVLTLIFTMACFLTELLRGKALLFSVAVIGVTIFLSAYGYFPTLQGYHRASVTVKENIDAIEESRDSGVLHLNMDVDTRYGYTPFYVNSYFFHNYLKYYHIVEKNTAIYLEGKDHPGVFFDHEQTMLPAIREKDGRVFLPLDSILELSGGDRSLSEVDDVYCFHDDSDTYWAKSVDGDFMLYDDEDCTVPSVAEDQIRTSLCSDIFLTPDALEALFGYKTVYEEETDTYAVTQP